jgi:hypothetical protein
MEGLSWCCCGIAVLFVAGVVRGLKMRSGFSATEIFRKYLWYLLRERKFDEDAVTDLAVLRTALSMSDEEVSTSTLFLGHAYLSACANPRKLEGQG